METIITAGLNKGRSDDNPGTAQVEADKETDGRMELEPLSAPEGVHQGGGKVVSVTNILCVVVLGDISPPQDHITDKALVGVVGVGGGFSEVLVL